MFELRQLSLDVALTHAQRLPVFPGPWRLQTCRITEQSESICRPVTEHLQLGDGRIMTCFQDHLGHDACKPHDPAFWVLATLLPPFEFNIGRGLSGLRLAGTRCKAKVSRVQRKR